MERTNELAPQQQAKTDHINLLCHAGLPRQVVEGSADRDEGHYGDFHLKRKD
jgi:hypothetical protein